MRSTTARNLPALIGATRTSRHRRALACGGDAGRQGPPALHHSARPGRPRPARSRRLLPRRRARAGAAHSLRRLPPAARTALESRRCTRCRGGEFRTAEAARRRIADARRAARPERAVPAEHAGDDRAARAGPGLGRLLCRAGRGEARRIQRRVAEASSPRWRRPRPMRRSRPGAPTCANACWTSWRRCCRGIRRSALRLSRQGDPGPGEERRPTRAGHPRDDRTVRLRAAGRRARPALRGTCVLARSEGARAADDR